MGCAQVKSKKNTEQHQISSNIQGNLHKSTPQQQQQPIVIDTAADKTYHIQITGKTDTAVKNANLSADGTPSKKQSLNEGAKNKDHIQALPQNAEIQAQPENAKKNSANEDINCEENDIEECVGTSVANKVQQVQISQRTQPYFLGSIQFSQGNKAKKDEENNEKDIVILEEDGEGDQNIQENKQDQSIKELSKLQDQQNKSEIFYNNNNNNNNNNQGIVIEVDIVKKQNQQSHEIREINVVKIEGEIDHLNLDKDAIQQTELNKQLSRNIEILLEILKNNQPSVELQQQGQLSSEQNNNKQLNEQLKRHVMLLLKLHQFDLAFDITKRYISIDTNIDEFQLAFARALHFQGQHSQALQLFKKRINEESLSQNGIQAESLEGLFGCMLQILTQDECKTVLDEVFNKGKNWNKLSTNAVISLANQYVQLQEFEIAKQLYKQQSVSSSYLASQGLVLIKIQQDQKSNFKQYCNQAIKQAIAAGSDENSLEIVFLQQLQQASVQSKV